MNYTTALHITKFQVNETEERERKNEGRWVFLCFCISLWNCFIWIIPQLFISPNFRSHFLLEDFHVFQTWCRSWDYDHGLTTQQPRYHNLWRFIEAVTTTSTTGESTTASINVLAGTSRQRKTGIIEFCIDTTIRQPKRQSNSLAQRIIVIVIE